MRFPAVLGKTVTAVKTAETGRGIHTITLTFSDRRVLEISAINVSDRSALWDAPLNVELRDDTD